MNSGNTIKCIVLSVLVAHLSVAQLDSQAYLQNRRAAFRVTGSTLAHVNTVSASWFGGSGVTEQITITPSAGNLLVLGIGWANLQNISSVADGLGNTWTLIDALDGVGSIATYYAVNVAAGSTVITVTWAADPGFGSIHVREVSGASISAPLDVHITNDQANPGTGANAVTSMAVTTTSNGQYIFGFTFDSSGSAGTVTAGTGFLNLVDAGEGQSEYQVQTTGGPIAATFTSSAVFQEQLTAIATFK